jgi:hypothetical protein
MDDDTADNNNDNNFLSSDGHLNNNNGSGSGGMFNDMNEQQQQPRRTGSVDSTGGGGGMGSRPAPLEHQPSAATLAWKAQQEKTAKQKDVDNEKKRKELEAAAAAKMDAFKAERNKKQQATLATNKEAQKKIAAIALTGTTWAKVAALCDLDKEAPDREKMRLLIKSRAKETGN